MRNDSNRPVTIYISAAADLMAEREALARMIAGLPVSLAWRIMQTPLGREPLDLETLAAADLHLLVMGGDIRAPVGLEWHTAQRSRRSGWAFLKQGIGRTPAGQVFIGQIRQSWQPFQDAADLSRRVRGLLVEHLLEHAIRYRLTPAEFEQLSHLQERIDLSEPPSSSGGEAGRSAVILSRARFTPGDGIIVDDD